MLNKKYKKSLELAITSGKFNYQQFKCEPKVWRFNVKVRMFNNLLKSKDEKYIRENIKYIYIVAFLLKSYYTYLKETTKNNLELQNVK